MEHAKPRGVRFGLAATGIIILAVIVTLLVRSESAVTPVADTFGAGTSGQTVNVVPGKDFAVDEPSLRVLYSEPQGAVVEVSSTSSRTTFRAAAGGAAVIAGKSVSATSTSSGPSFAVPKGAFSLTVLVTENTDAATSATAPGAHGANGIAALPMIPAGAGSLTLTQADNGRTLTVTAGERIDAPSGYRLASSDSAVVVNLPELVTPVNTPVTCVCVSSLVGGNSGVSASGSAGSSAGGSGSAGNGVSSVPPATPEPTNLGVLPGGVISSPFPVPHGSPLPSLPVSHGPVTIDFPGTFLAVAPGTATLSGKCDLGNIRVPVAQTNASGVTSAICAAKTFSVRLVVKKSEKGSLSVPPFASPLPARISPGTVPGSSPGVILPPAGTTVTGTSTPNPAHEGSNAGVSSSAAGENS